MTLLGCMLRGLMVVASAAGVLLGVSRRLPTSEDARETIASDLNIPLDHTLWRDDRFIEMINLANDIVYMRWPVSIVLTACTVLLVSPLLLVLGLRQPIANVARNLTRGLVHLTRVAFTHG